MRKLLPAILLLTTSFVFAQHTIIYCSQLIDVKGNQVLKEMSIIVDGNKITDVVKGYASAAATDKVIEYMPHLGVPTKQV